MNAYPPGFPISVAKEQHPNFLSQFLEAFNASPSQPIVYREPELAPAVNNNTRNDFSVPVGDDEICEFVGTNLSKNMDSEEVEMASPPALSRRRPMKLKIRPNLVVNLSDKHLNTIFSYFQKK